MEDRIVKHRMADGLSGIETNFSTNRKRYFKYCKHQDIHPDDAHKSGCTVYDPAGVMAGIRWEPCPEEALYADPNKRVADEEYWAKSVCRKHYLEGAALLRRMKLADQKNDYIESSAAALLISNWFSYPEKYTVTLPGIKTGNITFKETPVERKAYTLDELLSPSALAELKEHGFVSFQIENSDGKSRTGWFSRKEEFVRSEKVVVQYKQATTEQVVLNLPAGE